VYLFLTFNRPMRVDLRGLLVSHAAGNGHAKIVRKLLENRAAIGNDMRGNALGAAARCGCLEAVELLDSADVWEDPRGSAVMNAAEGGHIAIVKFLLRNGNIVPENREMARQLALINGHHEVVIELSKDEPTSVD
jgi:ankyrin repeat protein